jgi:nucleoside-triphosphatase THEP1
MITGQRGVGKTTCIIQYLVDQHPDYADFLVDGELTVEVGGKNKGAEQIVGTKNAFLALDELPVGSGRRIPLWLFGFLY